VTTRRRRRSYTKEYKAEVVRLYRTTDKSTAQIARELDLTPSAVQRWIQQAEIDRGEREGRTTAEQEESTVLRRRLREVEEERDILKRAVAFFARETR